MLWEFIAVAFAGLSGAGIALGLRFLFKRLPKWIIPVFAGICMLFFTIYSEYHWYHYTKSRLPEGSVVVYEVPQTVFYKPWSYIQPQVLQFVVLDKNSVQSLDNQQKQMMLYFFERRMKAQNLPMIINCQTKQQRSSNSTQWHNTPMTENLVKNICQ